MKQNISPSPRQLRLSPIQSPLTRLWNLLVRPFKRQIETEIDIHASADEVYRHMVDLEHYANWSPFIKSISGSLEKQGRLKVFIQPKGEKGMTFYPKVVTLEANKEIRWLGSLGCKGLFDGEHYFLLDKISDHKTTLIHGENFKGFLVPMLWAVIKQSTRKGFIAHNHALKSRAESASLGPRNR